MTHRDHPDNPLSFNQVLLQELRRLRPDHQPFADLTPEPFESAVEPDLNEVGRGENLREIFDEIGKLEDEKRLCALCLSGGGIRSATFNLGILQGLARLGLLDKFDYLSTVSGGGFIGAWLKTWMARVGTPRVCNELAATGAEQPLKPEPRPIDRLREFSNYLTPRKGLLSGDTWAAIAMVLRNLILNWSVVVPVLMVAVGLPQLYLLALESRQPAPLAAPILGVALALGLVASFDVHRFRHPLRPPGTPPRTVFIRAVVPLALAAVVLSLGLSWLDPNAIAAADLFVFVFLWCILVPLIGWSLREPFWRLRYNDRWPVRELFAMVVSGLIAALLMVWAAQNAYRFLLQRPVLYAIWGVPLLLGIYLVSRSVFVAFAEGFPHKDREDTAATTGAWEDADREWWARFSGYVVMTAVLWMIVSAIALVGWYLLAQFAGSYARSMLTGAGIASGIATLVLGKGGTTGSGKGSGGTPSGSRWQNWSLAVAAPLFTVIVLIALVRLTALIAQAFTAHPRLFDVPATLLFQDTVPVGGRDVVSFAMLLVLLLLVGGAMGLVVNANRFSLHGFYRNRLIRAYLGASNPQRRPDPFTGFALNDNLRLHQLWREPLSTGDVDCRAPLLVVNGTLNLVSGERLAWQQRQAESFSMSPLFCGNFYEGYRDSHRYGSSDGGISVGTAVTISGAAANPNMGYHSSPAVTFLLTLFNARLGAWLGNVNDHGRTSYQSSGPRSALRPLFAELLGFTTNQRPFVQLSDGGHFDNLGLYEMVLRRCRFIVVSDAGRDPDSGFEDLGNAIRKIRIDFGISVVFDKPIMIVPRTSDKPGLYCAVGRIGYSETDGGAPDRDGVLLYLKPTLGGKNAAVPYDIFSYARAVELFPHERTTDQWFDESQFESYRALGVHVLEEITGRPLSAIHGWDVLMTAVQEYMSKEEPRSTPPPLTTDRRTTGRLS
jgi:hypothetical protein